MRAVRLAGKEKVELVCLEALQPAAGEVLLRILRCGLCGSDLHAYRGRWALPGKLGHEFCAVIEQVGSGVTGLQQGMRVAGECFAHCGRCEACRRGAYNHCESIAWFPGRPCGALAEFMTYPAGALIPVPEPLTHEQVAMVEPLAVAHHAVWSARVEAGQSVAVIGGGTIGLLCAAVARVRGASRVFLLAKYPHQGRKAVELGIATPLLPADGPPRERLRQQTAGRGVDVVLDCVAAGASVSTALSLVRAQGRVVELGGAAGPVPVLLNPLVDGELTMVGCSCYAATEGRRDFEWAIHLIAAGSVRPEALITHTFPLPEAAEAFRIAADKKTGSIKVMATMQ